MEQKETVDSAKYYCKLCDFKYYNKINLNYQITDREFIYFLIKENSNLKKEQSNIKNLISKIVKTKQFL